MLSLVPEARKPDIRQRLFSFLEEDDLQVSNIAFATQFQFSSQRSDRSSSARTPSYSSPYRIAQTLPKPPSALTQSSSHLSLAAFFDRKFFFDQYYPAKHPVDDQRVGKGMASGQDRFGARGDEDLGGDVCRTGREGFGDVE